LRGGALNTEIAAIAERALLVAHGSITVAFQDGKIVSMEVTEKIRFSNGIAEGFSPVGKDVDSEQLAKKLAKLFRSLVYGKIVLFIKNGKIIQYSRQEQYRLTDVGEGL
jgi:hypothetical protein